jgi:hypothetical protein
MILVGYYIIIFNFIFILFGLQIRPRVIWSTSFIYGTDLQPVTAAYAVDLGSGLRCRKPTTPCL